LTGAVADLASAASVDADQRCARCLHATRAATLTVRETGARLVNVPTGDLRAPLREAQRTSAVTF
jgi:hypothetical protein